MAQTASASWWDRTRKLSTTAYEKGLKPGFNKTYNLVNKLETPVNRLSHKVGSEAFWPTSLDKESEKAARILRSFCKDGVYDEIDEEIARRAQEKRASVQEGVPQGKQRVIKKIPAAVIQRAKGLAIFTSMRTGWVIGGAGGAGVMIGRHPDTGEWSPPSGIHMQNLAIGFLGGVDILDTVLVINTYDALAAFTKFRCTLGTEVGLAAGPFGVGGVLDMEVTKKPAPVWSYVKSRGLYGGIGLDGNVVIERVDENARFYGEPVPIAKIFRGEVRHPPVDKYKVLIDTVRAAQGDAVADELLPDGVPPSEMEVVPDTPIFGVPAEDDADPFGVKALEAAGLSIREAGTHRKASPDVFEFKPSPTSPVYRKSVDSGLRRPFRSSIASVSTARGTQTDDEDARSVRQSDSPTQETASDPPSPRTRLAGFQRVSLAEAAEQAPETARDRVSPLHPAVETPRSAVVTPELQVLAPQAVSDRATPTTTIDEAEPAPPLTRQAEKEHEGDKSGHESDSHDDYSDLESDVEISTAVHVISQPGAGVVNVPKRIPPALPPRNPGRVGTPTGDRADDEDTTEHGHEHGHEHAEPVSPAEPPTEEDEYHSTAASPTAEQPPPGTWVEHTI